MKQRTKNTLPPRRPWSVDLCNENNCFEDTSCQTCVPWQQQTEAKQPVRVLYTSLWLLASHNHVPCSTTPFILQDFLACSMSTCKGLANCCYCQAMLYFLFFQTFKLMGSLSSSKSSDLPHELASGEAFWRLTNFLSLGRMWGILFEDFGIPRIEREEPSLLHPSSTYKFEHISIQVCKFNLCIYWC